MNDEELYREFQVKAEWALKCVAHVLVLADKAVEESFDFKLDSDTRYDLVKLLTEKTLDWLQG